MRLIKGAILLILCCTKIALAEGDCIVLRNPIHSNASSKAEIIKPGKYCLSEDLHARIEFPDHRAEPRLIQIRSSDVVLDLKGHTLGRGRLFGNPGGVGIEMIDGIHNVTIRNGTIQDFQYGISYRVSAIGAASKERIDPTYDAKSDTYRLKPENIIVQKIRFNDNRVDLFFERKN